MNSSSVVALGHKPKTFMRDLFVPVSMKLVEDFSYEAYFFRIIESFVTKFLLKIVD